MAGGSSVPFVLDGETLRLVNKDQGYRYRDRQRYLQEDDRITIIRRLDEGERQSELAREFGVTRAAICNTYKNREEILVRSRHVYEAQRASMERKTAGDAREGKLVMKKRRHIDTTNQGKEAEITKKSFLKKESPPQQQLRVEPTRRPTKCEPAQEPLVSSSAERASQFQQLLSAPAVRLLSRLRDPKTSSAGFREHSRLLIRLLIEEALTVARTSPLANGKTSSKIVAIGLGDGGYPMLRNYQELISDRPVGIFRFQRDNSRTQFVDASLPSGICSASSVMLMTSECATGQAVCCAAKELTALGIPESSIFLVSILASKQGLTQIERLFPAIRGLVAAIDSQVDALGRVQPGCGGFLDRYYDVDDDSPVSP